MPQLRLPPQDYTVGWVCALPIELAAAAGMLDEEHQHLPQDANDTNLYTLGRIGEHNIVIACLPAGQMGTNSAVAAAVQMKSRFTSIRFGLMVGIGGGVPSDEADVRLGDVVISKPYMDYGGVVQYDFGKSTQSGFVRTGFLNTPPALLLNALAKLQANYSRRRYNLSAYLSALSQLPEFARDNAGPDLLFDSTYNHVGGPTCERCSEDRLLERVPRGSQEIMVHCGTIASGNQVIKDGVTRDRLSSELGGVLCFEMEAAGLMNSFPCLVIRGICDYADSHKNKRWQPYAAATAAACAKEILSVIPAAEVATTGYSQQYDSNNLDTFSVVSYNKHYCVPYNLSAVFTGRRDVLQKLRDGCLPKPGGMLTEQKRFVLYGLGGSGKTQTCIKFAQDCRER